MTTLALGSIQARPLPLNWRRISALSGSFTAHIALVLLLLIPPVALQLKRVAVHVDDKPIIVTLSNESADKEIPLPTPPPLVHKKATPHLTPVVTMDKPTPVPADHAIQTDSQIVSDAGDHAAVPSSGGATDIGGGDSAPSALSYFIRTAIPYPRVAVLNREQGTVMLRVLVGVDGKPQQVEIDHSSGSRALDVAARDAVKRWTFKPGMRGGVAYAAWARVPVTFALP